MHTHTRTRAHTHTHTHRHTELALGVKAEVPFICVVMVTPICRYFNGLWSCSASLCVCVSVCLCVRACACVRLTIPFPIPIHLVQSFYYTLFWLGLTCVGVNAWLALEPLNTPFRRLVAHRSHTVELLFLMLHRVTTFTFLYFPVPCLCENASSEQRALNNIDSTSQEHAHSTQVCVVNYLVW